MMSCKNKLLVFKTTKISFQLILCFATFLLFNFSLPKAYAQEEPGHPSKTKTLKEGKNKKKIEQLIKELSEKEKRDNAKKDLVDIGQEAISDLVNTLEPTSESNIEYKKTVSQVLVNISVQISRCHCYVSQTIC
jgi:hypothetical protein